MPPWSSTTSIVGVLTVGFLISLLLKGPKILPAPSFQPVGRTLSSPELTPLEGIYESNTILQNVQRLFEGNIVGSESVAISPDGKLYMLDQYGYVRRAKGRDAADLEPKPLAQLGAGRPLGFHFDSDGNLIICNAGSGLQMLEKDTNRVLLLASSVPANESGQPPSRIAYANDLDIATDGTVYFSDSGPIPPALNAAGFYDTMASFLLHVFQGDRTGRVLRYDPLTRETTTVATGIWFPNGVALADDASYLLVVETPAVRILQVWLKGPFAGKVEVWLDRLPGFPDGLTRSLDGNFWVSIVAPPQPLLQKLVLPSKLLRWLVAWLPVSLKPKMKTWGAVMQVSPEGEVLHFLLDPNGKNITHTSAATEVEDGLYFGNLGSNYVSFLNRSMLPPLRKWPREPAVHVGEPQ